MQKKEAFQKEHINFKRKKEKRKIKIRNDRIESILMDKLDYETLKSGDASRASDVLHRFVEQVIK